MSDELHARIHELAQAPVLLVASDFDGTIAPIVSDPARAEADRAAVVALKALTRLPQTHVAIISGRALGDLAARTPDLPDAHIVGSHGGEFEPGFAAPLDPAAEELLEKLKAALAPLAASDPGLMLELKPASVAFHYRNAAPTTAEAMVQHVLAGPAKWPGVHTRCGKMVIELSVVATHKGDALQRIRQRLGAASVLFLGDDVTDEDAFATLVGPDVGVKVGPGESRAAYRVSDTVEAARILARVAEQREQWLAGAAAAPIESLSMLSDQRTIALVDGRGRVVWMCLPRIDSSALFAELLGGPTAGHFEVGPINGAPPISQRYLGDTLLLETRWPGFTVVDYLDCSNGRPFQRAGRTDLIRVIQGTGRVRITFAPRLDFGRMETRLRPVEGGLEVEGCIDPIALRAPGLNWRIVDEGRHQSAVAEVDLGAEPLVLEFRYGTASLNPDPMPEPARRERTERFWSGWAASLRIPPLASELVRRSALTLKGLCYGPTGAIAAAGTTSLPEHLGGVRNWDYRFCWPRDAAMSAAALVRLGATGPAMKLLDWLLGILDQCGPTSLLCPVYTVTGGHLGAEGEIAELAGYRGSRPVRVGNAAAQQVQLDVFGPIVDLVALLAEQGAALSSEHWRMVDAIVGAVEQRWHEPDHGIWEVRRSRRHHVHSKVMCWQMVDRALAVARYLGRKRSDWQGLRDTIATDVIEKGWKADCGAFCATYEDHEADAAALWVGLSGLLAPHDPRFQRTIDYVERHLRTGPTVLRYVYDDGLPGIEGGFHICTTWLIETLTLTSQIDKAQALFESVAALAGPTGLLSEQYDAQRRTALGNHPQAYSHLGLINAAVRLAATC